MGSPQDYVRSLVEHALYRPDRHVLIQRQACEEAWPGTGDHDRTPTGISGVSRGEFSSLALALGGHRPHPGASTRERMEEALNAGDQRFRVYIRELSGDYEVHRVR